MAIPQLSPEERQAALEKAKAARIKRAEVRDDLKSGKLTLEKVLEMKNDPVVGRMKVSTLIETLPGYGKAKAEKIMKELQKKTHMGIIFLTHNLGVVAEICDKVSVMYAGKIVEQGPVDDIFYKPGHPYTVGLLRSMPRVDAESYERLIPIEGTPVDMLNPPEGCPFAPRCEHAMKICLQKMPPYVELGEGHRSACWLRVQDQLDKAGQEKPVQDQEVSGRE